MRAGYLFAVDKRVLSRYSGPLASYPRNVHNFPEKPAYRGRVRLSISPRIMHFLRLPTPRTHDYAGKTVHLTTAPSPIPDEFLPPLLGVVVKISLGYCWRIRLGRRRAGEALSQGILSCPGSGPPTAHGNSLTVSPRFLSTTKNAARMPQINERNRLPWSALRCHRDRLSTVILAPFLAVVSFTGDGHYLPRSSRTDGKARHCVVIHRRERIETCTRRLSPEEV